MVWLRTLAVVTALVLLAGCGGQARRPATSRPAAIPTRTVTVTTPAPTTAAATTTTGAIAAALPAGGPVPGGFRAASVTFVSADFGYVLGTAPCAHAPCTSLLRTEDRGTSWVGLPAPPVGLDDVAELRFADPRHGFAYGPRLWETSDGGAHWQAAPTPGGEPIVDLEPVGAAVIVALTQSSSCASGAACESTVWRRATTGGDWTRVLSTRGPRFGGVIAVQGETVWIAGDPLLRSTDTAAGFTQLAAPCPGGATPGEDPAAVALAGTSTVALCVGGPAAGSTSKTLVALTGAASSVRGSAPLGGDGGELAAADPSTLVIASASGASWLYRSTDGGRHWSTALELDSGGAEWNDLGFTTPSDGVVIEGSAAGTGQPGRLYLTSDAGATWQRVSF